MGVRIGLKFRDGSAWWYSFGAQSFVPQRELSTTFQCGGDAVQRVREYFDALQWENLVEEPDGFVLTNDSLGPRGNAEVIIEPVEE